MDHDHFISIYLSIYQSIYLSIYLSCVFASEENINSVYPQYKILQNIKPDHRYEAWKVRRDAESQGEGAEAGFRAHWNIWFRRNTVSNKLMIHPISHFKSIWSGGLIAPKRAMWLQPCPHMRQNADAILSKRPIELMGCTLILKEHIYTDCFHTYMGCFP